MLLYETELKQKLEKLPDSLKKEVLDYVDYLSNKYTPNKKRSKKHANPFKDLAGFVSIGPLSSKDIDREVYNL